MNTHFYLFDASIFRIGVKTEISISVSFHSLGIQRRKTRVVKRRLLGHFPDRLVERQKPLYVAYAAFQLPMRFQADKGPHFLFQLRGHADRFFLLSEELTLYGCP